MDFKFRSHSLMQLNMPRQVIVVLCKARMVAAISIQSKKLICNLLKPPSAPELCNATGKYHLDSNASWSQEYRSDRRNILAPEQLQYGSFVSAVHVRLVSCQPPHASRCQL